MAYERINWENAPSTDTPINADNLNAMDNAISNLSDNVDSLTNKTNDLQDDIDLANARMDVMVAIPPGSTTENSELLDIRLGADGTSYNSAGAAVRGQIEDLNSAVDAVEDNIDDVLTMIVPVFSPGVYNKGDLVRYENDLYECISKTTSGAAWDSTKWSIIDIAHLIRYLHDYIAKPYASGGTVQLYDVGALCFYDHKLYRALEAMSVLPSTPFDNTKWEQVSIGSVLTELSEEVDGLRGNVTDLKADLNEFGAANIAPTRDGRFNPSTLIITASGHIVNISGTTTGGGYTHFNTYTNSNGFPDGISAGQSIQLRQECDDNNIKFRFFEYINGSESLIAEIGGNGTTQVKISDSATGCIVRISIANGHTYSDTKTHFYIFNTLTKQQIESSLNNIYDELNNGGVLTGSVSPTQSGYRYTTIDKLTLYAGRKYRITTYANSSMTSTANIQVRVGNTNLFSFSSVNANSIKINEFVPEETVKDAYIAHYNYSTAGTIYDEIEMADSMYKVPMIYKNQLETKTPVILGNMDTAGANGETFVFITDLHWETNFQKSPSLIKYLLDNTNINNLLCGGDIINQGEPDEMKSVITNAINAFNFKNVFFPCAVGNHDDNSNQSSASKIFPQSAVYARMLKQIREHATLVTFGPWNYYYDLHNTKTRVIILDTGSDGTFTNYSELYAMLSDAPSGYHILILAHWLYNNGKSTFCTNLETIVDAYNDRGTGTVGGVAYDFTNTSANVSIIIAGHVHTDMDWTTSNGVPVVLTDCDCALRTLSSMEFGTTDEQCFDVITLDYNNGTAKFVRIGRGSDRTFQI